ncbi:hypothetical protein NLO98_20385 [Pseudomonas syringae]|nr:hypothetical protein [Pseudomonas syringae]
MSDILFYGIFCLISLLLFLPSLWARFAYSGAKFTNKKSSIATAYNGILIFIHLNFIKNDTLPFIGEKDPEIIGWVSFAMLFLYIYALPTERNIKPWFFGR